MSSQAANFFVSIVRPTVSEFLANAWDVRRGRLAAIVLNHMADYVALEGYERENEKCARERLYDLHSKLITKCPDFSLVKDVADATKHAQLNSQKRKISSSEQITSSPGLFHAPFGEGVFKEAAIVFVTLNNGTHTPLEPAIRSVMAMWEASDGSNLVTGS